MMLSVQQELVELGSPTDALNEKTLGATLLTVLGKFASHFKETVDGRGSSPDGIEMNELYGGARISYIFHEIFARSLSGINPFDGLTDQDIRTAIYNANGTRPSLFVPEMSFDLLVRRQIARLEQPGLQCADLVFDEMQRIAAQCEGTDLTRFPTLKDAVIEVVHGVLRQCMEPTQSMISNLIRLELAYINTSHPDFIGGSRAVAQLMDRNQQQAQQQAQAQVQPPASSSSHPLAHSNGGHSSRMPISPVRGDLSGAGMGGPSAAVHTAPKGSISTHQPAVRGAGEGKGGLMSYIFGGGQGGDGRGAAPQTVKLPQVPESMRQSTEPTDRERIETEIIKVSRDGPKIALAVELLCTEPNTPFSRPPSSEPDGELF